MLPTAYQLPAGVVLLLAGLVACFAGYRLFRAVLTIYGFILGALLAGSLVPSGNMPMLLVALAVGGIAGAFILYAGYVAGVTLVGAALGVLVFHSSWVHWRGVAPAWPFLLLFAVAGAVAALYAQRVVVILTTAFAGAHTAVVGVVALLAQRAGRASAPAEASIGSLAATPPGWAWPFLLWIGLGVAGAAVQLRSGSRPAARRTT